MKKLRLLCFVMLLTMTFGWLASAEAAVYAEYAPCPSCGEGAFRLVRTDYDRYAGMGVWIETKTVDGIPYIRSVYIACAKDYCCVACGYEHEERVYVYSPWEIDYDGM